MIINLFVHKGEVPTLYSFDLQISEGQSHSGTNISYVHNVY